MSDVTIREAIVAAMNAAMDEPPFASTDHRKAAESILAIPEIAAGLAALRMIGAWLPVETERNHDGTITVWAGKHCADAVSLTSAVLALADAIEEAE